MRRFLIFIFLFFICIINILIAQNEIPKYKIRALKLDVFTPFNNHFQISYEIPVDTNRSLESSLGIIGLGKHFETIDSNQYKNDAKGLYMKLAYKWYFKKFKRLNSHPFEGVYLKYEIGYSIFRETRSWNDSMNTQPYDYKYTVQAFSMMVYLGKQFVFKDFLLLNVYGGVGAIFDNRTHHNSKNFNYSYRETDYLALRFFNDNRFSMDFGMSIGFLF